MSFGENLQFLRKMHRSMTQEELAEQMGVSRQTVSKWEMGSAFPETEKAIALSRLFNCSLDELLCQDMNSGNDAYENLRVETVPAFATVRYAVISHEPEDDAMHHIRGWAVRAGIEEPEVIGWDFPFVSQEQINVFHMHGYCAACVLPEKQAGVDYAGFGLEVIRQSESRYAVITIREPFTAPFVLIPNAYKTLLRFIEVNVIAKKAPPEAIGCFEKVYRKDGIEFMDVYMCVG
ncbi:MAG: helix-turn-helix transcriptional regulator [Clostridiaceae bacterium]|nr:helix-turn-helix transcriptional regulator [Clostridiaceae bacterium]